MHNLGFALEYLVKIPLGEVIIKGGFQDHSPWKFDVRDEQVVIDAKKPVRVNSPVVFFRSVNNLSYDFEPVDKLASCSSSCRLRSRPQR